MVFASGFQCMIAGCGRPVHAKGLCRRHYDSLRNNGCVVRDRMSRACKACGVFFEASRADQAFCSHRCRMRWCRMQKRSPHRLDRTPNPLRRSRYRVDREPAPPLVAEAFTLGDVWERSDGVCRLCGRPLDRTLPAWDKDAGVPDWIVSPDEGGPLTLENRIIVHRSCWSRKASGSDDARNGRKASVGHHGGTRKKGR